MNTSSRRNENSVQMSLKELRELHTTRMQAEHDMAERAQREAQARAVEARQRELDEIRAEKERRLEQQFQRELSARAAEHELQLAKEKARVEADARVREKQLEVKLRQTDAEIAKMQAHAPRRSGWGAIAVVAVVFLAIQGGMFWQQRNSDASVASMRRALAAAQRESRHAGKAVRSLQDALEDARGTARASEKTLLERIEHLEDSLARTGHKTRPHSTSTTTTTGGGSHRPDPRPVEVDERCLDSPLC